MNLPLTSPRTKLWDTSFSFLFASHLLKGLADQFASVAFVWLLLESGGGAVSTSLLYMSNLVPIMLFGVLFSPLLQRGKMAHWMCASDVVRGLLVLLVPLCHWFGYAPVWLFFVSAFWQSTCGSVYQPASVALLSKVVVPAQIQAANAVLQSSQQVIRFAGLMGAGVLIMMLSARTTLVVTAGVLLLSAVLVLRVSSWEERAPRPDRKPSADKAYLRDISDGFTTLRQHRLLYIMTVFFALVNVGVVPLSTLMAVYVHEELQGSAVMLTLLQASQTAGAFVAGIWLTKVTIRRHGALFLLACLLEGIAMLGIGSGEWLWLVVLGSFLFGMAMTAVNVPEMVLIQTTVPAAEQAKVYAIVTTISTMLLPVASLMVGPLAEWIGAGMTIMIGGIFLMVSVLVAVMFTPLSRARGE
ncbi:MFS transporter [Brevibacillus dissolubilis]|uniref:MFS transporter n=1 Tax=Brevibacillus dissolubilis TaxID=1844116 RepID=UPI0011177AAC|nr:MFS transporter [Brevibacillus dissolubilis]